jgi:hypothetical protein
MAGWLAGDWHLSLALGLAGAIVGLLFHIARLLERIVALLERERRRKDHESADHL